MQLCMMRNYAMSVVDSQLKSRCTGLDALRVVVETLIMPAVSSTSTNTPTIRIAKKGAILVLAVARQRLAA